MASTDTTVTYEVITPADELQVVTNALRDAEMQHFQMSVNAAGTTAQPGTPDMLATLAARVEALQAQYADLKAKAEPLEVAQPTPPAAS